METPRSRGDLKWIDLEEEFYNGRKLEGIKKDFSTHKDPSHPDIYNVYIYADRTVVEVLQ
jgi:hypothetical protein